MKRIIITGANGVGKSHFASELALARPDVPVISFDGIKLLTGWKQRPRSEINAVLAREIERDAWILEGGPSLLSQAIGRADALVWLDPPDRVRAWQLASRPWKSLGKTRPELPTGNVDWPWQQYKFAMRSLKNKSKFQTYISEVFHNADGLRKWRCHCEADRVEVRAEWTNALA